MAPLDTSYESQGAEFLVLGLLLTEGIAAYKAYVRTPGFDIVANGITENRGALGKRTARISVKSRYWNRASGCVVTNFEFDFLVYVRLNRGGKSPSERRNKISKRDPELYVYSIGTIQRLRRKSKAKKFRLSRNPPKQLKNRWDLISKFIATGKKQTVRI
jgi:hypothetical protein